MSPALIILVVILAGALAVFLGYLGYKAERERAAALAAMAAEKGWRFDPVRDRSIVSRYGQFDLFTRGHSREALNTMYGSIGGFAEDDAGEPRASFRMGDYRYKITRSTGKSTTTTTYNVSYLLVDLPFSGVPDVTIRPEGFLDMVAQAIGFDDIDFEDAEFSRMFMVKSRDKRFAYDLCHPRMIEWLKASERRTTWVISGGSICLWSDRGRWDVEVLREAPERVREFFSMWPKHIVRDLAGATKGEMR